MVFYLDVGQKGTKQGFITLCPDDVRFKELLMELTRKLPEQTMGNMSYRRLLYLTFLKIKSRIKWVISRRWQFILKRRNTV